MPFDPACDRCVTVSDGTRYACSRHRPAGAGWILHEPGTIEGGRAAPILGLELAFSRALMTGETVFFLPPRVPASQSLAAAEPGPRAAGPSRVFPSLPSPRPKRCPCSCESCAKGDHDACAAALAKDIDCGQRTSR